MPKESVPESLPSIKPDVRRIEAAFGIKPRDWQRELEKTIRSGSMPAAGDRSMAALGYPELHTRTFFLTDTGLRLRAREQSILFPPNCCVCDQPISTQCETAGNTFPYCNEHRDGLPRFLLDSGSFGSKGVWVSLTGLSPEFLDRTEDLNRSGDVLPPWEVFPEYDSLSGFWKQGGQFWLSEVFGPFWRATNAAQRAAYLEKWRAPDDWREWLGTVFRD